MIAAMPVGATGVAAIRDLDDLADAEWLYAWSLEGICPTGVAVAVRVTALG